MTNRYLFHWLSPEKLVGFTKAELLKPYWRHFILGEERFVRGVSLSLEPMLWAPDEELPREPCLILDRGKIDCAMHMIDSGRAYHLTKDILRARRGKRDVSEVIEKAKAALRRSSSRPDEAFVEGPIKLDAVVAIGFEANPDGSSSEAANAAQAAAETLSVPVLDMTGWTVGDPGYRETDEIVEVVRNAMSSKLAL